MRAKICRWAAAWAVMAAMMWGLAGSAAAGEAGSSLDWWSASDLVDYGIVAAGITGYVVGERIAAGRARMGPVYEPGDPGALAGQPAIDETYLAEGVGESVPTSSIHGLIAAGAFFVAGLESSYWVGDRGSMARTHDAFVGYAETVAVTAALTSLVKPAVGRLRPDFEDRALNYYCAGPGEPQDSSVCDGFEGDGLDEDPAVAADLLDDGQRSFFSGHSSHSFNVLGYTALLVGGRYVWGEGTGGAERVLGVGAQAAMMGVAGYISGSRISDGRHHASDVVVGSLVGLGVANLSYWRRFDRQGELRRSGSVASSSANLQVGLGMPSVQMSWRF